MSEQTIVERVARAMKARACDYQDNDSPLLAEFGEWGDDDDFTALAHAAILAMREYTEAMDKAGFLVNRYKLTENLPLNARITLPSGPVWQAMIDAAMSEI